MNDQERVNAELHGRIQRAVETGQAQVVAEGQLPATGDVVGLLASNLRANRSLLEGLRVYLGSKDPDVNAGTFDARYKHATPQFSMARGYAETANATLGLVSKATTGLGMLAEYELPRDAVFYRNFGAESDGLAGAQLSVSEAESRLKPLVERYVQASNDSDAEIAHEEINSFFRTFMYELALPAGQMPVRQWVVQSGEKQNRLLVHQDRGPLADVMIDVLLARKSAVDEHTPNKVSAHLRRGGVCGFERLEAFCPGVTTAIVGTVERIDTAMADLRGKTRSSSHDSLSEAIVWRKEAQKGIQMSRLTNTGFAIEHDDARLRAMPLLQEAMDDIERAVWRHENRSKQEAVFATLNSGLQLAQDREQRRHSLAAVLSKEAALSTRMDKCKEARRVASEGLEKIENLHAEKMKEGLVSRLLYKFGDQKQVLADMAARSRHIDALDEKLFELSSSWRANKPERETLQGEVGLLSEKLSGIEQSLLNFERSGDLCFLPPNVREKMKGLSSDDWGALVDAASVELKESDDLIAKGLAASKRLHATAAQGLGATMVAGLDQQQGIAGESLELADQGEELEHASTFGARPW